MTQQPLDSFTRALTRILEALWLAVIVLVPLVFTIEQNTFALPKNALFRMLVLTMAVIWIWLLQRGVRPQRLRLSLPMVALGGLLLASVAATIWSVNPWESFWGTYNRMNGLYSFFHVVAFALILWSSVESQEQKERLLKVVSISAGLVCLYGVLQHYQLTPFEGAVAATVSRRIIATLGNALTVGGFIVTTLPISIWCLFVDRSRPMRWLWVIVIVLQLVALLFSLSRSAWIACALGFVIGGVVLAVRLHSRRMRIAVFSLIVVAALAGSILARADRFENVYLNRLVSIFTIQGASFSQRAQVWPLTLSVLKDSPIVGVGMDQFLYAYQRYYPPAAIGVSEELLDAAHNYTLNVFATTGVVGGVFYLAMLAGVLWLCLRNALGSKDPWRASLGLALFISGISFFVQSQLTIDSITMQMLLVIMVVAAGWTTESLTSSLDHRSEYVQRTVGGHAGTLVMVVSSVFALWGGLKTDIRPWQADYAFSRGIAQGTIGAAQSAYNNVVVGTPYQYNYQLWLARVYVRAADYFTQQKDAEATSAVLGIALNHVKSVESSQYHNAEYYRIVARLVAATRGKVPEKEQENPDVYFTKSITLAPARVRTWWDWGEVYLDQKDQRAVEKYRHALELAPSVGQSHYLLARSLESFGKKDEADREFKKAKELGFEPL